MRCTVKEPMEIKRSDVVKWAQNTQPNRPKTEESAGEGVAMVRPARMGQVNVDTMHSRILSLQQEVRDLQTGISMRQVQLGFVNQLQDSGVWQKELRRFMDEQFPATKLELRDGQSLEEFQAQSGTAVNTLRGDLIKKEIQIQNILSAGFFEPSTEFDAAHGSENSKLMKDFSETQGIFSRLRPDAVKSLLN